MAIAAWLKELGLERYEQAFRENEIDFQILRDVTAEDLKDIGVVAVGHRRKLLRAIAELANQEVHNDAALERAAPITALTPDSAPRTVPERRQLTVMFVDLVGSTALSSRLDPEDMRTVLMSYQNTVAGVITQFQGFIAKFMGDGVLAYFGYPRAHEDEAERAARAGLAVVAAVKTLIAPTGEMLAARVGVSSGLVVVGDHVGHGAAQEQAVIGETPNLAARLQSIAEPGQVVIADQTRRLLGASIVVEALGERDLKGIEKPIQVYAVVGERAIASRFEARAGTPMPLVGRDHELALLQERWTRARAGEGQCVLLVGEAGIGKSRITRALLDKLAQEPHSRIRYQCSPYHTDSALWPAIQQLIHAANIAADDSNDVRIDKLEALVAPVADDGTAALIADLLGLDAKARYGPMELAPQAKRARTLEALVQQLLALASRHPVLMVVEDTHWIDPTTLELIELCLDRIVDRQVLFLLTSRPEDEPAFAAHQHITRLTLNRLGRSDVESIALRLGNQRLPTATIDAIIARADGVPLFAEELTKAVFETGSTAVPASLHDSLIARLDRIPEDKEIAQIAACIGRDFDAGMLTAVADKDDREVSGALDRLAAAGVLIRRGARSASTFSFKHALLRDAAYESMLIARRRTLHHAVLAAYETSDFTARPEVMARHCQLAGDDEKAAALFADAGRIAEGQSAMTEAARHYRAALESLHRLTPAHHASTFALELWLGLCRSLLLARGHIAEETLDAHEKAKTLALDLDHIPGLFRSTLGLYYHYQASGDYEEASKISNDLISIAESDGQTQYMVAATRAHGAIELYSGRFLQADESLTRAIDGFDMAAMGRPEPAALNPYLGAHYNRNICTAILGQVDTARSRLEAQLEEVAPPANAADRANALTLGSAAFFLLGDEPRARQLARDLSLMAREHGLGMYQLMGQAQAAPEEFTWRDLMDKNVPTMMAAVVILMRITGHPAPHDSAAIDDAREALEALNESGVRWMSAEIGRALAHADLAHGRIDMAMAGLERAATLARAQGALWFELRAARDLARLWAKQGERPRAHDRLEEVYRRFTEGFESPDLMETRALLNTLQSAEG